jgi:uncharacterized membrane protein
VQDKNFNKSAYIRKTPIRNNRVILPSPAILKEYDEVSEGAADRLIEMAEIEQEHRHEWELAALAAYDRNFRLGQKCGALVAMSIIGAAIYVGHFLHDYFLAGIIAASGFASIIVSTIFASKNKRYENRIRRAPIHKKDEQPKA